MLCHLNENGKKSDMPPSGPEPGYDAHQRYVSTNPGPTNQMQFNAYFTSPTISIYESNYYSDVEIGFNRIWLRAVDISNSFIILVMFYVRKRRFAH